MLFRRGDIVRVIKTDSLDENIGISVGDLFCVLEGGVRIPICLPLQQDKIDIYYRDGYAFVSNQLELVPSDNFHTQDCYDKGDIVVILTTDYDDEEIGIKPGDIFVVEQKCSVPYCSPLFSEYKGQLYALYSCQLAKIL